MKRRLFLALIPAALAAGCGFQLRRHEGLPFASLYIDAPAGSTVAQRLRTMLATDETTRLTATAGEAEAVLRITGETHDRSILTLTGGGPGETTEMLVTYVYTTAFVSMKLGYAAALSVVMVVISMMMVAFFVKLIPTEDVS